MLVPFAQDSQADRFARWLAARIGPALGRTVAVENRPGGHGSLATLEVVQARPDGRTMLFGTAGTLVLYPLLAERPVFDPLRDLVPVSVVGAATIGVAVRPDTARGLVEFLSIIRVRPGERRYGSQGAGTYPHLAMEALKQEARGIDMPHMTYPDGGAALAALLAGEVDAVCDTLAALIDAQRAGQIRILAVCSAGRSLLLGDVQTVAEALKQLFEAALWMGVMLPAGTSDSTRARLASAIHGTLADASMRAIMERAGIEVGGVLSPPEIGRFLVAEQARWRPVAQASGVRID